MEPGESIKIMRKELGMTQVELAGALHVSSISVSRWEVGSAIPQAKTIDAILVFAEAREVSEQCRKFLKTSLHDGHKEVIRVPASNLYPVERKSICQLVDESYNAIYVVDMETNEMLYMNHRAEKFFDKRFEPGTGQKCYEFMPKSLGFCDSCRKGEMPLMEFKENFFRHPTKENIFFIRGKQITWNGKKAHVQYLTDITTALEKMNLLQGDFSGAGEKSGQSGEKRYE